MHNYKVTCYDKANVETPLCYNATVMYFVSESLCLKQESACATCLHTPAHNNKKISRYFTHRLIKNIIKIELNILFEE